VDGPDVEFKRAKPGRQREASAAGRDLATIEKALPTGWLKAASASDRFEAFRSLPEPAKLELLAYCVASTLQPKLAPAEGEEATGYDAALSLTGSDVAGYWRPAKDNFLGRVNRDQLLSIYRQVLGDSWAQVNRAEKKSVLVVQLDRAFSNPDGHTPEQVARLKSWLPQGMSFDIAPSPKPAKAKKAGKAA
jgi:ParB family chromosome partitioning protein